MSRSRTMLWPGAVAGLFLWVGCNEILGTKEPIEDLTQSGGAGVGGSGASSVTGGSGPGGSTGGTASCADDGAATWVLTKSGAGRFGDGSVNSLIDSWTGLSWGVAASGTDLFSEDAPKECTGLERLPTITELISIVNYSGGKAGFYQGFTEMPGKFWTSTVTDGKRWAFDYDDGQAGPQGPGIKGSVRCVQ